MHVTPIAITDPPLLNAAGLHAPFALRTIIELVTEDDISGISEIPGGKAINGSLEEVKDLIIGIDPFQLSKIMELLKTRLSGEGDKRGNQPWDQRKLVHIFRAVEVACLDIIGKICDRPIVDLLGGKHRDYVPFAAYLFYKTEGAGGNLGAAIPQLDYALDTHYPWQSEEIITEGSFTFEEGSVAVPKAPGLGVTLDRKALGLLHEQYLKCGLTERNDEIEMQKIQPGWTFQTTRW